MKQKNGKEKIPHKELISRDPFSGSKKIYVPGTLHHISVGMRDIDVSNTLGNGSDSASITIYDTSGPYTDPDTDIDVLKGLYPLREKWIKAREDVEQLDDFSSDFSKKSAKIGGGAIEMIGSKFKDKLIMNSIEVKSHLFIEMQILICMDMSLKLNLRRLISELPK